MCQNVGIRWSGRDRCVRTWALGGVEGRGASERGHLVEWKGEVCQNVDIWWSGRERCVRTWALGGVEERGASVHVDIRWSGKEKRIMYKVHQGVQDQYKLAVYNTSHSKLILCSHIHVCTDVHDTQGFLFPHSSNVKCGVGLGTRLIDISESPFCLHPRTCPLT